MRNRSEMTDGHPHGVKCCLQDVDPVDQMRSGIADPDGFGFYSNIFIFLMAFIRKHSFTCFGWYRIVLGILVLILGAVGVIGGGAAAV